MRAAPGAAWVFHAGALGDSVLIWPLLRAMVRGGWRVTLASAGAKARLAAEWMGEPIVPVDIEQRWITDLFSAGPVEARASADVVVSFLHGADDAGREAWCANAAMALGAREVVCVGPPGCASRRAVWERFDVARLGGVLVREGGAGVVVHVGAGGGGKRWAIERWAEVVRVLRGRRERVDVIAGEVERETFSSSERRVFDEIGGRVIETLDELARTLAGAARMIGADTGPTHLAAQLGVATVALFGPTDPGVWGPVGPRVRVVAPSAATGMAWLTPGAVLDAVDAIDGR